MHPGLVLGLFFLDHARVTVYTRAIFAVAVVAAGGCRSPVSNVTPRGGERLATEGMHPRLWVAEQPCDNNTDGACLGIGQCPFRVEYVGLPAIDPRGELIATPIWEDPLDNLGDGDLGELRIVWLSLNETRRAPAVVYSQESAPCEQLRAKIDARVQHLQAELESWTPLPRLAGKLDHGSTPGGLDPDDDHSVDAWIDEDALVFSDGPRELFRLDAPFVAEWDHVDAVYAAPALGYIVVLMRSYGAASPDISEARVVPVPPVLFTAVSTARLDGDDDAAWR